MNAAASERPELCSPVGLPTAMRRASAAPARLPMPPKLILLLNKNNFELLRAGEWMTQRDLSENSWNGFMVVKKKA